MSRMITVEKTERNYGIDLLKIISMFMVCVLHILQHGGLLWNVQDTETNYFVIWILEISSFGAVNMFAIATGYLMVNKRYKFSRIINLWLEVLFYSVMITLVFKIIYSENYSLKDIAYSCFPVMRNRYWYFSAYFGLYILIPLINKGIDGFSNKQLSIFAFVLFFVFSFVGLQYDAFHQNGGYSWAWLCLMYIIGCIIKRTEKEIRIKKIWLLLCYLMCVTLTMLSIEIIKKNDTLNNEFGQYLLFSYVSPTILIGSISLVLFCSKVRLSNIVKKIVVFLSPLSFAVYLIHEHPIIRTRAIIDRFVFLKDKNSFVLLGGVLCFALIIYLGCSFIEYLRTKLFKWLRINKLCNRIGSHWDKKMNFDQENTH